MSLYQDDEWYYGYTGPGTDCGTGEPNNTEHSRADDDAWEELAERREIPGRIMYPDTPLGYVDLPIHEYAEGSDTCKFCGDTKLWESYESYREHWFAFEYEGPVVESDGYVWHPEPQSREVWEYVSATCVRGQDGEWY